MDKTRCFVKKLSIFGLYCRVLHGQNFVFFLDFSHYFLKKVMYLPARLFVKTKFSRYRRVLQRRLKKTQDIREN